MSWPLLWADQQDISVQPEAQTQDRKLEKQLIVSKDRLLYSTLLAWGQVEKMREQSNKLENLECCFAKQRGHKLP